MEIKLRKPARQVFEALKSTGGFLRVHKKSLENSRVYYRLMSPESHPIKNIIPSDVKQLLQLDALVKKDKDLYLKDDVVLFVKKPKDASN